jgi:hypothetical protein
MYPDIEDDADTYSTNQLGRGDVNMLLGSDAPEWLVKELYRSALHNMMLEFRANELFNPLLPSHCFGVNAAGDGYRFKPVNIYVTGKDLSDMTMSVYGNMPHSSESVEISERAAGVVELAADNDDLLAMKLKTLAAAFITVCDEIAENSSLFRHNANIAASHMNTALLLAKSVRVDYLRNGPAHVAENIQLTQGGDAA